jgi:beta-glucosidase
VHLKAGESQKVRFELKDRNPSRVTEAGEPIIAEGKYSASVGGGQPNMRASAAGTFQAMGSRMLPE